MASHAHGSAHGGRGRSRDDCRGRDPSSGPNPAFDGSRDNAYDRHPRMSQGPPQGHGSVPQFLLETVQDLKGHRSEHGLNSSHSLMCVPHPGARAVSPHGRAVSPHGRSVSPGPRGAPRGAPGCGLGSSSHLGAMAGGSSGCAPAGAPHHGRGAGGPMAPPPGAYDRYAPRPPAGGCPPPGHGPQPGHPGSYGAPSGSYGAPPGHGAPPQQSSNGGPPSGMGGPPPQAQWPPGPPGHGLPTTGMTQGNLPLMTNSQGQLPPHNPHTGFGHGARPLPSGHITPGHGPPIQSSAALQCQQVQAGHFPPGYGPNCRPLPSGHIPPGHGGYAVSYTPPAAAAPKPQARPPANIVCKEDSGSLPMDSCLWAGLWSSPTPARGSASTTPASTTDRSMTNGFKDSTDYLDAGYDSEAEFLTSRSMPPPRRKAGGGSDGRSHRKRDEASCIPCLKCF